MMQMKLPLVLGLVVGACAIGCAPHAQAPAGVPVHPLVAEKLTLRGTAPATLANPACSAAAPAKPEHVIELGEDTRATILLTPAPGEAPLPIAMLHLTNLDSNRTWCVMTKADGTPAALAGEFPMGLYAVSVAAMTGSPARNYQVKVEKL